MPTAAPRSSFPRLQLKGALQEDALYIERAADAELERALLDGEYCYVLAPRQIGKSSLRLHTARALAVHGVHCVHIDLTIIGGHDDQEQRRGWYFSLISVIATQLGLDDPLPFWQRYTETLPVFAFGQYLREHVLAKVDNSVVVFIDEIDYLKSLPFDTDEFIDAIRAYYNARGGDSAYQRLSFCLLGVAAPSDLIRSAQITPFNIGQPISVTDFCRQEMEAFAPLFVPLGGEAATWIDEVYSWTTGHPYMTQVLCDRICSQREAEAHGEIHQRVERAVSALFLRRGRTADPNLSYAEKRLDSQGDPLRKAQLLSLYRRLLQEQSVSLKDGDPVQMELQLCGMAAQREDEVGSRRMLARNAIFTHVFDLAWVRKKEAQRLLTQALQRWQESGRRSDTLLRRAELEEAQQWAGEHSSGLTQDENEFLRACLDSARREAEQKRLASEALNQRRIVLGLAVVIVILLALAAGLYEQFSRAERSAKDAFEARGSAERLAHAESLARQNAESVARTEKSLRAAMLATQPGSQLPALLIGMQAALPERKAGLGPQWEGANRAAEESTLASVLQGHLGSVGSAAFSPNGQFIVTASEDHTARVWDAQQGRSMLSLRGHSDSVWSAVYSSDGQRIVTASSDGTARVWDAHHGLLLLSIQGHSRIVRSAAFSPDGQRIVTASEDGTARIWDARQGLLLLSLQGHSGWVRSAAFSPDGQLIVTASDDHTARVWNAKEGRMLLSLKGHSDWVRFAAFSPDGQRIVTASSDRTARVWDAKEGRLLLSLQGHSGWVRSAAFSSDGQRIVTASEDLTARVWDAKEGRLLLSLQGHSGWVRFAAFSPDGLSIATASEDRTARVWDAQHGRLLLSLQGHSGWVRSAAFSFDGQRVVTASEDRTARVWNAKEGHLLLSLQGHLDSIWSAMFSRDGLRIVTASSDRTARVWDARQGRLLLSLQGHTGIVRSAAFSPDGLRIVTASEDRTARVWDALEGRVLLNLQGHSATVRSATFSPDGQRIVTASEDRTARVWDAVEGRVLLSLQGHSGIVRSASLSPDGQRIVTASDDRTARVWDAKEGRLLLSLQGHSGIVRSAAFSPDGQRIVTASDDHMARIWDSTKGRVLLSLQGHAGIVRSAAFSPDGQRIVTASDDRTAIVHPINPESIYAFDCQLLRNLRGLPGAPNGEVDSILATCFP